MFDFFEERRGNGYSGYSMSNNAIACYDDGIYPISKWTKDEIISQAIGFLNENVSEIEKNDLIINLMKKSRTNMLKGVFLEYDSWHHSSKFFNKTTFYKLNTYLIEELSEKNTLEIETFFNKKNEAFKPEKKEKQKEKSSTNSRVEYVYIRYYTLEKKRGRWVEVYDDFYGYKKGDWAIGLYSKKRLDNKSNLEVKTFKTIKKAIEFAPCFERIQKNYLENKKIKKVKIK